MPKRGLGNNRAISTRYGVQFADHRWGGGRVRVGICQCRLPKPHPRRLGDLPSQHLMAPRGRAFRGAANDTA